MRIRITADQHSGSQTNADPDLGETVNMKIILKVGTLGQKHTYGGAVIVIRILLEQLDLDPGKPKLQSSSMINQSKFRVLKSL
jgi:hypothetical protein